MKLFFIVVIALLSTAFHDVSAFVGVSTLPPSLSSSSLPMVMKRRGSAVKPFKSTLPTTMFTTTTTTTTTTTRQYASPKEDESSSSSSSEGYNDDAFGFVFLVSAFATQDQDFAALFLITSAIAATLTLQKIITYDVRIPAVVAFVAVLVTPLEMSLRLNTDLQPPSMTTVGLGAASAAFAFFNWNRQQE